MRGFVRRHTVEDALAIIDTHLHPLAGEFVPLSAANGRVLADDIVSHYDVPGFDRAMMDGYAMRADDTNSAAQENPVSLNVIADAFPGRPFQNSVAAAHAVRIMTGAPLPDGCDAVVPVELVDASNGGSHIKAFAPVSAGKHVGHRGEDVVSGTNVFKRARVLRPQDLGVLSSIGQGQIHVIRKPRVRLVVTGDELLPAGSSPRASSVVDANGPMLAALAERDGAVIHFPGPIPDERDGMLRAMLADADVIIVSGGSSVGIEDHAPSLLLEHGELIVHGIAMRPGAPTGFGRVGERLVFLLPGNPVSCLCAYDFFAGRSIRALGGRPKEWPYRSIVAPLARSITSPIGRLSYARVQVVDGRVEQLAVVGASVLSSTTRADGFVVVPAESGGFAAETDVTVWLYG